jgi:hypothetical protein
MNGIMKTIFTTLLSTLIFFTLNAQTGINTTTPNSASILDVESTNKGVLYPRIQLQSRSSHLPLAAIPPNGTMVFNIAAANTGANKLFQGFYFWDVNQWKRPVEYSSKPVIQFTQPVVSTANFNTSAGEFLDIFNTQKFSYDGASTAFTKVSNTELRVEEAGLYQVTINLALKEAVPVQNSVMEFYVALFLDNTEVDRVLSRVPQWRENVNSNMNGRFQIAFTAYVQASSNQTLRLKSTRFNTTNTAVALARGVAGAANFDAPNTSSITILKLK